MLPSASLLSTRQRRYPLLSLGVSSIDLKDRLFIKFGGNACFSDWLDCLDLDRTARVWVLSAASSSSSRILFLADPPLWDTYWWSMYTETFSSDSPQNKRPISTWWYFAYSWIIGGTVREDITFSAAFWAEFSLSQDTILLIEPPILLSKNHGFPPLTSFKPSKELDSAL